MRRFLIRILVFSIPLLLASGWVFSLEFPLKDKWSYVEKNCPKAECLYHLIHENDENIDIAFVGSSKTLNAIDDTLLSSRLNLKIANLGYCRYGRNLHYLIVKDLFQHHQPKKLFLEVRITEDWYGHFDFGHIANTDEMLASLDDGNPKVFRDVYRHFETNSQLLKKGTQERGEGCSSGIILNGVKNPQLLKKGLIPANTKSTRHNSEIYINAIYQLAKENNCQLYFLFMPYYGGHKFQPHHLEYYQNMGTVLPGIKAFENPEYWSDNEHLSVKGSYFYTDFVEPYILE